jgi:hypothetical protein
MTLSLQPFRKIVTGLQNINSNISQRVFETTLQRSQRIGLEPYLVDHRLQDLEIEWSAERALLTQAGVACLVSVFLGKTAHRKFFYAPAVIGLALTHQSLFGWSPPFQVLRFLGFRTSREIETERQGLKALRGDYNYKFSPFIPLSAFEAAQQ